MQTKLVSIPLGDVKANPYRDIENYRLSRDKIESLKASIHSTGFWPGVMVRDTGSQYQLLFGHHRLTAAIEVHGPEYEHEFILRDNVSDHMAIRMLADENADSWAMDVQHSILCVKQAKKYFDDMFVRYPTWDDAKRGGEFPTPLLCEWFGPEGQAQGNYAQSVKEGVGRKVLTKFLGGVFEQGDLVKDALALIKDSVLDEKVAGSFINMAQAKAFQKALHEDGARLTGLQDPEEQRRLAEAITAEFTPQGNSLDPKRKGSPSHVPEGERLTAKAVQERVRAEVLHRRDAYRDKMEPSEIAKFNLLVIDLEKSLKKTAGLMALVKSGIEKHGGSNNLTAMPSMSGLALAWESMGNAKLGLEKVLKSNLIKKG
jgi:hypothetical protein